MPTRLSVSTINLFNLQLPRRGTYPGARPLSAAEYRAKLRFLGLMLRAAEADVFCFQELWAAKALRDAFTEAKLLDGYEFIARDAPGPGRPQVAIAARKGMIQFDGRDSDDDAFWVEPFPDDFVLKKRRSIDSVMVDIDRFSRPIAAATVQPEKGPPIKVFGAHLKSKRPISLDRPERENENINAHSAPLGQALASIRRTAEAAALRVMLDRSMEGNRTPHILLGDLNNGSLSVSTSILTGDPRYKLIESSRDVSGKRADKGLYSVERLMQYRSLRHTSYTHIFEDKPETLDHILVSEEFYDHSPNRIWAFREAEVFNDHLTLNHDRDHINAQLEESAKDTFWPTDHGVVRVIFDHKPMQAI